MRGYYINLDRSTDRRQKMEERMLPVLPGLVRIQAATPDDVPPGYRKAEALAESGVDESGVRASGWKMRTAAVGCSHMRCWQAVLDGAEEGAFVFEDDVMPLNRFKKNLEIFEKHPDRQFYDLIYINRRGYQYIRHLDNGLHDQDRFVPFETSFTTLKGSSLHPMRTDGSNLPPTGLDGYYLTKHAAETLLKVYDAFDEHFNNDWTVLSVCSVRVPRPMMPPSVNKVLFKKGLINAVRSVGSLRGGVFRTPLVQTDPQMESIRRKGADAAAAADAAKASSDAEAATA